MSDNVTIPATGTTGTATPVIATDDIAGVQWQRIKVGFGADGSASDVSQTAPLPVSAKTDLTPAAPTFATVGAGSGQALAGNANRKGLVLVNTSSNLISIGFGANPAVLGSGISLVANGGVWTMDEHTFTTATINAIAGAGSSNLSIQEYA